MQAFRINKIYLFSVPLYNNYENVYDKDFMEFYNENKDSNDTIKNSLVVSFALGGRMLPLEKRTFITIPIKDIEGDSVQDLNKVTYCVLEQNNGNYYYYFVTAIDTNLGVGAVTFSIEWDAWQNNINDLKNINNQLVSRRTRADELFINDKIEPYDNYSIRDEEVPYNDTNECIGGIIWERLLYDADMKLGDTPSEKVSSLPPYYPLKVVYRPFIMLSSDLSIDTSVQSIQYREDNQYKSINFSFVDANFYFTNDTLNSHLISRELTLIVPFEYENVGGNYRITSDVRVVQIGSALLVIDKTSPMSSFYNERIFYSARIRNVNSYDVSALKINDAFNSHLNGALLKYPYYKKEIRIDNDIVSLPPNKDYKHFDFLILSELIYWNLQIFYQETNHKIPFNVTRELPINKDSLTEYLRSSKYSDLFSKLMGFISTNQKKGGLKRRALNILDNSIGSVAQIADIINASDNLTLPNTDLNQLFRLSPVISTKYINDDSLIDSLNYEFNYFGIESNESVNIFDINHLYFDYYKVPNPVLNLTLSSSDNETLINILQAGVRIWHCDKSISFKPMERVMFFNYEYYNFCKYLFEYIEEA